MKPFLIALLSAATVFLLVSAFLPTRYTVERSLQIPADPEELYAVAAAFETWTKWSAWNRQADPEAQWSFTGTGSGAAMEWQGPELGAGRLTWVAVEEPRLLRYTLSLPDGSAASSGELRFEPVGEETRVVWLQTGPLDSLRMRWVGLFLDERLGKLFLSSLRGLRGHVVDEV